MRVLGIETTCDESAAAVVRLADSGGGEILSNEIMSQIADHAAFGGVVPEIAARAHVEVIDRIIERALDEAGLDLDDLDGIAAAAGPGLIGGVLVGLTTAKAIALALRKPLLAINHLEAHALTARLTDNVPFPYLLLLVSGGHTQLVAVRGVGDYLRLGTTVDDAIGEAFDKVAKLLGLPYPGGPAVEARARDGDAARFDLPRPMVGRPAPDFSLAGLKTAVRLQAEKIAPLSQVDVADLCASFQAAIVDVVIDRTRAALRAFRDRAGRPTALVAAGGVASNEAVRRALTRLAGESGLKLILPPPALCTDNGAMIAWAGIERLSLGLTDDMTAAARPRWPLDPSAERVGAAGPDRVFGRIAILGAGAWGMALAHVIGRPDRPVHLLCRDPAQAAEIEQTRQSERRLPGVTLGPGVLVSADFAGAAQADLLLAVVPAQCMREALDALPDLRPGVPIVICAKGIEAGTGLTMSQILAGVRPRHPAALLSGPSFAADVGRGRPTALCVAAVDEGLARELAGQLGRPAFRLYFTTDVRGVEIGGAAKNVLAIACGIAAGLDLGASASAALIARGFAEMSRFGEAVGARPETLMGLSGLGDLVLTCSSDQSRNFAFGLRLSRGAGGRAGEGVVEGVATAPALAKLATSLSVDMPIVAAVAAILAGTLTPSAALDSLLARPFGPERPSGGGTA